MHSDHTLARLKRKLTPISFLFKPVFFILLCLLIIIIFTVFVYPKITKINYLEKILFAAGKSSKTIRQNNNQVNLLVMGIGGGNHEGADLTDSIILVNLNLAQKKMAFITIPRDLWIDELQDKINTMYEKGKTKSQNTGLILSKATVSQITGINVDYAVVVDFHAFAKIVDIIGGVDINIENTFNDNAYPIEGKENDRCGKTEEEITDLEITDANVTEIFPCRFEKLHFEKGIVRLDGATALKYVRSRHSTNSDEGTDFARSKRQVKLISAIRARITKPEIYLNPKVFMQMSADLKNDIVSDLSNTQMLALAGKFAAADFSHTKTLNIDQETSEKPGLLINPPSQEYNGAWVLIPKNNNYEEIHRAVKLFLTE